MRERLIEAGIAVLERDGLAGATLRTIAREAGVSHGAPRRYFPTLAALLSAIASTGFDDLARRVQPILASENPATDQLLQIGHTYVAFALERPAMFALMFRHDLLEGSGEGLRERTIPLFDAMTELFRGTGRDPRSRAVGYWTSLHGIATLAQNRSLELIRGRRDADDLIRQAFHAFGGRSQA